MKSLLCLIVLMTCFVGQTHGANMTIAGSFNMNFTSGSGSNLEDILGHDNGWVVTLEDVTIQYGTDFPLPVTIRTSVHASSFNFQFTGEDADFLNTELVPQFTQAGIPDGAFFEAINAGWDVTWGFSIWPSDPNDGVSFHVDGVGGFALNKYDFPIIESTSVDAVQVILFDRRGTIDENIAAINSGSLSIVPIPSAIWLFGSAFIGIVSFKRKFRKA